MKNHSSDRWLVCRKKAFNWICSNHGRRKSVVGHYFSVLALEPFHSFSKHSSCPSQNFRIFREYKNNFSLNSTFLFSFILGGEIFVINMKLTQKSLRYWKIYKTTALSVGRKISQTYIWPLQCWIRRKRLFSPFEWSIIS